MTAAPFPWREAMAFGLGRLRWSPDRFWAATPRELAAALDGALGRSAGPPAIGREALQRLMRAYPDAVRAHAS